jgi:beta-glucosidase
LRRKRISIFLLVLIISGILCSCNSSNNTKNTTSPHNSGKSKISTKNNPVVDGQTIKLKELYDSNKSVDENITSYLNAMTLKEKVGQMMQVERQAISSEDIQKYCIGSVFAGGGSAPEDNTVTGWHEMIDQYKLAAKKTRLAIPLIFAVDAVHGNNNLKDSVIFPHNIALGASVDTELISKVAAEQAYELTKAGIDWTFAPCVAVSNDIRWGRTYESFGENPDLVSIMSIPYIKTLQENGIIACAKHYVADGAVEYGSGDSGYLMDQGNVTINQRELNDTYITVYREAVKAGVKTVMVSYSSINNIKNHSNGYLIQDVLKNNIGFKGLVISDYEGIHQVQGDTLGDKAVAAVNAGVDVIMEASQWKECYDGIIKAVDNNQIKLKRIDDAVSRILRVKMEMGKFIASEGTDEEKSSNIKQVAQEAVRKSLVLLKNNNNILPLSKEEAIAVIGPASDNIGVQCGGWTKTWQGGQDDEAEGRWMSGTSILDGFKEIAGKNGQKIITDPTKLKNANVVIAVIGEYPYAEGKGDDDSLSLDKGTVLDDNMATLEAAYSSKKPVVVILVSGRPRLLGNELNKWAGLVQAWLPGTEGEVIAQVLYGDYGFTGILPVTWPKSLKQLPITINNQENGYEPLFSYGFGLKIKK